MAQQLKAQAALPEDLSSVPSTHTVVQNQGVISTEGTGKTVTDSWILASWEGAMCPQTSNRSFSIKVVLTPNTPQLFACQTHFPRTANKGQG